MEDLELESAQQKVNELIQKDKDYKSQDRNVISLTYSYLENHVCVQPTGLESYLDRVSTFDHRQKERYQPVLTEPIDMPEILKKVLRNLSNMEQTNLDSKKIIAPAVYTLRYYRDIYKHRKVLINNKTMFQLEYTGEIIEDLWIYILTQELKRVNPNSIISFKWIHQPEYDFIDGYYTYTSVWTDNESLQFDYCEYMVTNMYTRLKILAKLDALVLRFYPCLRNFPKFERHSMVTDIRQLFIKSGSLIQEGASCKSIRKTKYQEAIGKLHELSRIITLAENLGYISIINGMNTRLTINEIIGMTRNLLQKEVSGYKKGTLRLNGEEDAE